MSPILITYLFLGVAEFLPQIANCLPHIYGSPGEASHIKISPSIVLTTKLTLTNDFLVCFNIRPACDKQREKHTDARLKFKHAMNMDFICTHTHPFNGPFSGTTQVSRYQKGKTNLDFTGARDSEWQWHQLGCVQSAPCSRQITMPAPHHSVFYRPDALPAAQPTV